MHGLTALGYEAKTFFCLKKLHFGSFIEAKYEVLVLRFRCCKSLKVCFWKERVLSSSKYVATMGEIFTTIKGKETICNEALD